MREKNIYRSFNDVNVDKWMRNTEIENHKETETHKHLPASALLRLVTKFKDTNAPISQPPSSRLSAAFAASIVCLASIVKAFLYCRISELFRAKKMCSTALPAQCCTKQKVYVTAKALRAWRVNEVSADVGWRDFSPPNSRNNQQIVSNWSGETTAVCLWPLPVGA